MSQFFEFPVNRRYGRQAFSVDSMGDRTGASEVNDNDYSTFSTEKSFILQTHGDTLTTNSRITAVYIIAENLTNYSVSVPTGKGSGTGITAAVIPDTGVISGRQYDLRTLGPLNATEVQVDVTGTDTKVYEILALDAILSLRNAYTRINPQKVDRGALIRRNIRGNLVKTPGIEGRQKFSTDFTGTFLGPTHALGDRLIRFFDDNPNFTFAEDVARFPDRIYAATLAGGVSWNYRGSRQYNQRDISFTVLEL